MPKERKYTSEGHLEVSWYRCDGAPTELVCVASVQHVDGEPQSLHMHQFTDGADLLAHISALRRAYRQAFDPRR